MTDRIGNSPLGVIYRNISPRRRLQLYALMGMLFLGAAAELAAIAAVVPFLTLLTGSGALDRFAIVETVFGWLGATSPRDRLVAVTAIFGIAALVAGAIRVSVAWTIQSFAYTLGHELSMAIQSRLLYQPYSFHASKNSSELVAAQEKIYSLIHTVVLPIINGVTAGVTSLFIVAILFYIDPLVAGIAVAAIGAVYVGVTYVTRQRLRSYGQIINSAYALRVQAVQESIGGIRDILIDQSQPVYLSHFERVSLRLRRAQIIGSFISTAPRYVVEAIGMVLIALLALVLSSRSGGFASALPVLGALALSAQRLLPLLQQVYYGWAQARTGTAVAGDIASLLQLELSPERMSGGSVTPLPFRDAIRLDHVSFSYPGRSELALVDINLTISRGSKVALIGKTGSGKSTLVDLLMGLLEPSAGSISIDGVKLSGKAMLAWQAQIAHVPQAIFLADTTIERNIAFGVAEEELDPERVQAAARLAQIHDFIEALPEGYSTYVGERGIRLSGGQRQRLGIARALYQRTPVLVLDEATSALDRETEAAVMAGLSGMGEAVTIVMIAHRLSTVASCDTIVRLSGGRIAEIGSYADVVGMDMQKDIDRKFG